MAHQVAPHPIVAIAEAVGKKTGFGIQQQAGRFRGRSGNHHEVGGLFAPVAALVEVFDSRGAALLVGHDFPDHAFGAQRAVAGGEGARDHRVVRAALGVDLARKAHAPAAAHAPAPAVVRHRVAQHRKIKRMEVQPTCRGFQDLVLAAVRQRGHGQRPAARPFEDVVRVVTGNTDFPFRLGVVGLQVLIADGPVVQGAARHGAVRAAHAKVFLEVAPRHGAVTEGTATHARGVVVVSAVTRYHHLLAALGVHDDAPVTLVIRTNAHPNTEVRWLRRSSLRQS